MLPTLMWSQISTHERPISEVSTYAKIATQTLVNVPVQVMPSIDLAKLKTEDEVDEVNGVPPRFGKDFDVQYHLNNTGYWETMPNGDRLWRLRIRATGARSINFAYDDFWIPAGAKLFIYNTDKSHVLGAFTSANNKATRKMGTGLVYGDEVTIEYYEPQAVAGTGNISISKVVHGYRFITPPEDMIKSFGDAGSCTVNVICSEGDEWRDQLKGVAMMLIGSTRWCSGSLIYTTAGDCIPYFLTANHCLDGRDAIDNPDMSAFSFYWRYESPDCGHNISDGPTNMSTAGATVVASPVVASNGNSDLSSDFALLLLTEDPAAAGYDVYFNGWDRRGPDSSPVYAPTACNGIHHPRGDVKKISTDVTGAAVGTLGKYWRLFWEATDNGHSVTEGGSSGSPLFDATTKRIIGQLFGGSSLNCTDPANDLGRYGGMFYSFNNADDPQVDARSLAAWLDPDNTGAETVEGSYPCANPFVSLQGGTVNVKEGTACETKSIAVNVLMTQPTTGDTEVTLTATGTADGSDYTLSGTSVGFPDGTNNPQMLTIEVEQDALLESTETVILTITTVTGSDATIGSNNTYTLNLTNDDAVPVAAGTILEADFEDDLNGFTSNNVNGGPSDFILGNTADATSQFWTTDGTNTSQFAFINEDACNCVSSPVHLVSSVLDFSAYASGITLTFDQAFSNINEAADVIVSTDGTNFTPIYSITNTSASGTPRVTPWVTNTVNLDAYAGESTIYVGFSYDDNGTWGYGMAVDNIMISSGVPAQSGMTTDTEVNLGPNETVHFYEPTSGHLLATIENLSDHDYGCTNVAIDRAGTSAEMSWEMDKTITSKTFRIIPENNHPTGSYKLTLYYNEDEIAGWENADASDDMRTDMLLIKTPGTIMNGDANNYETQIATIETLGAVSAFSATFDTGFSGFALGNVTPNTVLPLDLLSFEAQAQKEHILLAWTTAEEINHKGFYLQRSNNGRDFEDIAWIPAQENHQAVKSYTHEDHKVRLHHLYYYRLRQIDRNNQESLSSIETAALESMVAIQMMPNPVRHILTLQLNTEQPLSSELRIVDVLGQLIYQQAIDIENELTLPIEVQSFSSGVYYLQWQTATEVLYVEKFVKH